MVEFIVPQQCDILWLTLIQPRTTSRAAADRCWWFSMMTSMNLYGDASIMSMMRQFTLHFLIPVTLPVHGIMKLE